MSLSYSTAKTPEISGELGGERPWLWAPLMIVANRPSCPTHVLDDRPDFICLAYPASWLEAESFSSATRLYDIPQANR